MGLGKVFERMVGLDSVSFSRCTGGCCSNDDRGAGTAALKEDLREGIRESRTWPK